MTRNRKVIEIAGELRQETEKAYLMFDGDKESLGSQVSGRVG